MTSAAVRRWWCDVDLVGCADREREREAGAGARHFFVKSWFFRRPPLKPTKVI
jgi:hypothetical protein